MEINTTFVAVTRLGAACPGVGSPWTNLVALRAKHALGQSPVLAAGAPGVRHADKARRAAFWPVQAPMTELAVMAAELLHDGFWDLIEPLLPPPTPKPKGGRPRLSDRACLRGIMFVLRSGIPWEMLPQELGCGSGMTCWRRLRDWQEAGIWQLIHFSLLDWLARYGEIDWSRAVVDGCSIRAVFGGGRQDRIPPTGPSWAANVI